MICPRSKKECVHLVDNACFGLLCNHPNIAARSIRAGNVFMSPTSGSWHANIPLDDMDLFIKQHIVE